MAKSIDDVCATTARACQRVADDLDVHYDVVRDVVHGFWNEVLRCLKAEIPFTLTGQGKFFFKYYPPTELAGPHYKDKVLRKLRFEPSYTLQQLVNGWVHDLGIKDNTSKSLLKVKIRPDEIQKLRKRKILEDQRSLGFRPELLFDEDAMPDHDRDVLSELDEAPTVDEIIARINFNIQANPR